MAVYILQEGFGLSSSPVLHGQGTGHDVVLLKHVVADEVYALNRRYGVGPACDSLDHRAGACYLPRSLCTMNFVMPLVCAHSRFHPPHFECALHSVSQGFHHSGAKTDVFHSLIDYCAGPETQQLNIAGS